MCKGVQDTEQPRTRSICTQQGSCLTPLHEAAFQTTPLLPSSAHAVTHEGCPLHSLTCVSRMLFAMESDQIAPGQRRLKRCGATRDGMAAGKTGVSAWREARVVRVVALPWSQDLGGTRRMCTVTTGMTP